MKVLMVGDVVGEAGCRAMAEHLPRIRAEHGIDLVIANVENAAGGFGVTPDLARRFLAQGVDVLTTGNHVWDRMEIADFIAQERRLLRPANFPADTPGRGHVVIEVASRRVAVVNLMGRVGMSPIDCPFRKADEVLADLRRETPIALVDMHAESTAESVAMGYHLDGRVSAVAGTHRHVQTADETILPGGTAYITDLGMTGPIESVLGLRPELMIRRLMSQMPVRLEVAAGRAAIHGAIITLDAETGRARAISRLRVTG
jgi:hypothetical protein